jgi:hypothetical protein
MLQNFFNALFGCSHQRTTFPLTPGRRTAAIQGQASAIRLGTYVVCLDCGKEFAYDWQSMRVGQPVPASVRAEAQPSFR